MMSSITQKWLAGNERGLPPKEPAKGGSGRILPTRKNAATSNSNKTCSKTRKPKTTTPLPKRPRYNSLDEIVDESDALLRAAYEAQALGRLNVAHTYLLLAHGRLIGLGRFLEQDDDDCFDIDRIESEMDKVEPPHQESESTTAVNTMATPHGVSSSLKPMITPSPLNDLSTVQENNSLSFKLAQSAQALLYNQKGIGNMYPSVKERKARNNRQRKARAESFDSSSNWNPEKENVGNLKEYREKKMSVDNTKLCTLNASIMTANFASLDAKSWLTKETTGQL